MKFKKHQNPVKPCSLHPKDQEKGSLTSQESLDSNFSILIKYLMKDCNHILTLTS